MKKVIALILSFCMTVTLVSCGRNAQTSKETADNTSSTTVAVDEEPKSDAMPKENLLPSHMEMTPSGESIISEGAEWNPHSNSEVPPLSLAGNWVLEDNGDHATDKLIKRNFQCQESLADEMECLPAKMILGTTNESPTVTGDYLNPPDTFTNRYMGTVIYNGADDHRASSFVIYDTSGDTLALGMYEYDGQYAVKKVQELDYQMEWVGWKLKLTYQGESCTYYPYSLLFVKEGMVTNGGGLVKGYSAFEDMIEVFPWHPGVCFKDEPNAIAKTDFTFDEDGTMSMEVNGNSYSCNYRYSGDVLTLLSEGQLSLYAVFVDWNKQKLEDSMDTSKLEDMGDSRIEMIAQQHDTVLKKLEESFQNSGLDVVIDEDTGSINMDSSILFAVDDATLSDEGKAMLDKFIEAYVPAILSEECKNYVSQIVIEGHTDTSGSYDYNMELSKKRAASVADYYRIESRNGLSKDDLEEFTEMLSTEGCSYDQPIYKDNGEVDMDASRRVTFKFQMNLNASED